MLNGRIELIVNEKNLDTNCDENENLREANSKLEREVQSIFKKLNQQKDRYEELLEHQTEYQKSIESDLKTKLKDAYDEIKIMKTVNKNQEKEIHNFNCMINEFNVSKCAKNKTNQQNLIKTDKIIKNLNQIIQRKNVIIKNLRDEKNNLKSTVLKQKNKISSLIKKQKVQQETKSIYEHLINENVKVSKLYNDNNLDLFTKRLKKIVKN